MCGEPASAESVVLRLGDEPGGSGREINRRTGEARRALSSVGRRGLIPVALSTVVLLCVASYFTFRSRPLSKMPATVPAPVSNSSQSDRESAAVPLNASAEVESVGAVKPELEETSKAKNEDPADLWKRVRKGDAVAEVALARLYLSGVGVERSCDQAHVLLSAASRKRNKAADGLLAGPYAQQCP